MTTFANSGSVQPVQGGEVACCSIAGGPFAAIDGYVSGGAAGVQLELRLYATVGTLRTIVARALYAGPPVGIGAAGSLLEWVVIGDPNADSPVVAGGTQYDLVVFGVTGAGAPIQCTLAGTNAYDPAVNTSATVALPSNYGSTTIATNVGCAQLGDLGVDQTGLPQNVAFDILASCGAGSVEARVATGTTGGADGLASVIRDAKLPVATQYRAAVRETTGGSLSGTVKASLATYVAVVVGAVVVPPSAITPGPQITTLRSVVPTAPTTVVWASTGYVDFVADCGADPTGVADTAPAWEKARVLLEALAANPELAETALELYFPPGFYNLQSVLTTPLWNFLNKTTSLILRGTRDASILAYSGFDGPQIANVQYLEVSDLTFYGTGDASFPDCGQTFELFAQIGVVQRCRFQNILASFAVLALDNAAWVVRDCQFTNCSVAGVNQAVLYAANSLKSIQIDHCDFLDVGHLNGATFTTKTGANQTWVRINDGGVSNERTRLVLIKDCSFDESCRTHVWIHGGPTGNFGYVRFEGNHHNSPIIGNGLQQIRVDNTDELVIEGMASDDATGLNAVPMLNLFNVNTTRCRRLDPATGENSRFITADAACNYIRVEDSPQIHAADFFDGTAARSLAKTNELKSFGTDTMCECYVGLTTGGAAVGSVLKLAAGGYAKIAITDAPGLAAGVSLDAVAGVLPIRIARRGQIVTMLSDGTGAIAVGDPVTNTGAAAAGQVLKAVASGTTPIIGTAVTAAAGGGGPVLFDVLFETGQA